MGQSFGYSKTCGIAVCLLVTEKIQVDGQDLWQAMSPPICAFYRALNAFCDLSAKPCRTLLCIKVKTVVLRSSPSAS